MCNEIAIIGMATRLPGANNLDELLNVFSEGKDLVSSMSEKMLKERTLPLDGDYHLAGYLDDIDKFDHNYFNISLAEAQFMDPSHRLLLEIVHETFENAGYIPDAINGNKISVYVSEVESEYYKHAEAFSTTLITGNKPTFLPTRISRHFGLTGNAMLVDTACSSGAVAIHLACNDLKLKQSEYAIVCGSNLYFFPFSGQNGLGFDSPDGKSKAFDERASGMSKGESVAAILLKPLDKAIQDGDNIHAVILGSAVNNNADKSTSPTAPDSISQITVIKDAWENAKINPLDIGYIEAHGSGTQLGDTLEIEGLTKAFKHYTNKTQICPISTIKNSMGHGYNTAGILGIIRAVLALKNKVVFPIANFKNANPLINFRNSAVYINTALRKWDANDSNERIAGVTSIGASGTNCHIVLKEAPGFLPPVNSLEEGISKQNLFTFSAKTEQSLKSKLEILKNKLEACNHSLEDISFTLNKGRQQYKYRAAFLSNSIEKVVEEIKFRLDNPVFQSFNQKDRLIFILSDFKDTLDLQVFDYFSTRYPVFHKHYLECSKLATIKNNNFYSFTFQYCFYKLLLDLGITTNDILYEEIGLLVQSVINKQITLSEGMEKTLKHEKGVILNIKMRVKKLIEKETTTSNVFFLQLGPESEISCSLAEQQSNYKNYKVYSLSNSKTHEEDFHHLIKELYLSGYTVEWDSFYNDSNKGRIVELPGYQFEKIRCWLREKPAEKRIPLTKSFEYKQNDTLLKEGGNYIENKIAEIWSSLLDIQGFSIEDNFFELGGDSIKATKVINEIRKIYSLELDFEDIFDFPTLASLAQYLNGQLKVEDKVMLIWQEILKTPDIKPDDNFFELGGHSLLANQILVRVQDIFNIKLNFEDIFKYQTVSALSEFIKGQEVQDRPQSEQISKASEKDYYELSASQKRIWIISQFEGGAIAYNEQSVSKIKDNINYDVFSQSLNSVIKRHEILHTNFVTIDEEPMQKIFDPDAHQIKFNLIDLSDKDYHDSYISELILKERTMPFNLSEGYLFRVTIINLKNTESLVCFTINHIIIDGWSSKVFVNDLLTLYNSYLKGERNPFQPLSIQYKDYSEWQNNSIISGSLAHQKEYWHKKLSGEIPVLNLPYDKKRPLIQTFNGSYENFILSEDLALGITKLVQKENSSLFMVFQALVKMLLFKYTGQEDLIIGTPIAGRMRKELENQIGVYINTLALRDTIKSESTITEFLKVIKETCSQAFNNQDYPFDKLVSELDIRKDMSRSPLFDIMVMVENNEGSIEQYNNIFKSGYETKRIPSKFDLTFSFSGNRNGLWGKIVYNTDLFDQSTIESMTRHFIVLTKQVIEKPGKQIKDIDILTEEEKHQLLVEWNNTKVAYPKDKCIHQLFEEQVEKTPDNVAVVFENERLTYRQLNGKANQLGHYLQKKGVKPETLVGVCLDRSLEMIIGLLGILKAGGAYVPIDPIYPIDRISFMLEDCECPILLTNKPLKPTSSANNQTEIICLDQKDVCQEIAKQADSNVESNVQSNNLIYVIYTSGSTGKPKGVMVEHKSVVNLAISQITEFKITVEENILQFSSACFDASVEQINIALLSGAKLILVNKHTLLDTEKFSDFIIANKLTHIHAVPGFVDTIKKSNYPYLKRVIAGGDICRAGLVKKWSNSHTFYNEYGPTETTVTSIQKKYNTDHDLTEKVTIGKPIANTQVFIVDKNNNIQAKGIVGELCISGDGLARGYLKRPELTAEKFINKAFSNNLETRLYKTGDLARYLHNGEIEFLGRTDSQVKIRGYRIELGEIENAILKHEKINSVAVVVKATNEGENELAAYYVSENEIDMTEMHLFLSKTLPNYMFPSYFIHMDAIPTSPNGKINRNLLPEPGAKGNLIVTGYIAPRNEPEEKLASLWQEILGIEKVGINDNFFEIGGHSLKLVFLANKVNKSFNTTHSLSLFYIHPTINSFVEHVLAVERVAEEQYINLEEEAVLPEDIQINSLFQPDNNPPKKIFLTGATGFIGQFLLNELLCSTDAIIYCLVRSKNKKEGLARIKGILQKNNLFNPSFSSRIVPIVGDITKPSLDISENEYQELCREIDVVFHNAVIMNHHADYYTLKHGNVSAIIEVLRFAMKYKTKPIHYSSSTGIFSSSMFNEQPITEYSEFDNEKHLVSSGYLGSKWVAEKLIQLAKGRGFPINIYRLGLIIWDTKEGRYNHKQWFALLLQSCIQLNKKFYGFSNKIALTTVDFAAQAIVKLALKNTYLNGIYHINTSEMTVDEILQLYSNEKIELVSIKEWIRAAKRHLDSGGELAIKDMFADVLNNDLFELNEEPVLNVEIPNLFDASVTLDILAKEGMHFPEINEELINKYFQHVKKEMEISSENEVTISSD